jgi:hypothetical protein
MPAGSASDFIKTVTMKGLPKGIVNEEAIPYTDCLPFVLAI